MELNLRQNQLGVLKGDLLKLEIDPKVTFCMDWWKTKVNG
jgi:hypothetical protein